MRKLKGAGFGTLRGKGFSVSTKTNNIRRHNFGHGVIRAVSNELEKAKKHGSSLHELQGLPNLKLPDVGTFTATGIETQLYSDLTDDVDTVSRPIFDSLNFEPGSDAKIDSMFDSLFQSVAL